MFSIIIKHYLCIKFIHIIIMIINNELDSNNLHSETYFMDTLTEDVLSGVTNLLSRQISNFAEMIKGQRGNITGRTISDLNKAAQENSLTVYGIVSSNVSSDFYQKFSKGIETKLATLIRVISSNTISGDITAAQSHFQNNFTNFDDSRKVMDAASNLVDSTNLVHESVGLKIDFTGSSLLTEASKHTPVRNPSTFASLDVGSDNRGKDSFMSPGSLFNFKITGKDDQKRIVEFYLSIFVRANLITVESDKLVSALAESRERDNFYQYIKLRAGNASFLKDFVLNLNTIKNDVKRSMSSDLDDRIISELSRKTGTYLPKLFGDFKEFKNFVVVIDTNDSDRLSRDYGLPPTKASALKSLFQNMNMMTLCIVDDGRKKVIMFDSDRPEKMQVISMSDLDKEKKLAEIFSKIN